MIASEIDKVKTLYSNELFDLNVGRRKSDNTFLLVKCGINKLNIGENHAEEVKFTRELEFVSKLEHPNIARPVTANVSTDTKTIVYQYNDSVSLSKLIEEKKIFSINDSVSMITQLLDALEYLHSHGVVVCNINPGVLVSGAKHQLEIIDLSSAHNAEELDVMSEGIVVGTFPYLSPEQTGFTEFKIDQRSDLYCTGLILYQLLAGRLPFPTNDNNLQELLNCILKTDIDPIKNIPSIINEILIKALRPTPSERYQSAAGFSEDLKTALVSFENGTDPSFTVGAYDALIAINHIRFFVARDLELRILYGGLKQLSKGESSTYLLSGVSGIGKSSIVSRFKSKVKSDVNFITVKCNKFTPNKPFSVLHQILDDVLVLICKSDNSGRDAVKSLLNGQLAEESGVICKVFPELAKYFDKITECQSVEKEADRINHLMLNVLALFLDAMPNVLFIDDIQWIDRESFEIIVKIKNFKTQCMCVYTIRTDADETTLHIYNVPIRKIADRLINILPFSEKDISAFIRKQFDHIDGSGELIRILLEKGSGNPLIIKEIISYLVTNGFIKRVENEWKFDLTMTGALPEKFDTVSLIMDKYKNLSEDELHFLKVASLLSGTIERKIISKICELTSERAERIFRRLEQIGYLSRNITGNLNFAYDKIQEILINNISEDQKEKLSEQIASEYEQLALTDKNYLFPAVESLIRTRNIEKTFDCTLKAARFAAENNALDIAIKHFRNSLHLSEQLRRNGYKTPVFVSEIEIELAEALMMTGKNEQALNIYKRVIGNSIETDRLFRLQLMYRIGSIYHNTGNYNQSIPQFIQILAELGFKYPKSRPGIFIGTAKELILKLTHKILPLAEKKKKNKPEELLMVRVLNKLSGSLYYDDIPGYLFTNFKAVNLADKIIDCEEKAQSYALHGVPAFQLFCKKRGQKYIEKAYTIARNILRPDIASFSELFHGIISYFNAQWQNAEKCFMSSINGYQLIGDKSNQLSSAEHLWRVYLMKGDFCKAKKQMEATAKLCEETSDKHFLYTTLAAEYYIDILRGKKPDIPRLDELEIKLNEKSSSLSHIHIGVFLIYADLLNDHYSSADMRLESLISGSARKNLNSEYIVPLIVVKTELLLYYLIKRDFKICSEQQMSLEFKKYLIILRLASWCYPAYRGNVIRIEAMYCLYRKRIRKADNLFKKAVTQFHSLDMQYEKAKTLREYGAFYDEINSPGRARDMYNDAYTLFEKCGAVSDCDKLKEKASSSTVKRMLELSETELLQKQKENSNQIRFNTLLEVCSSMSQINDLPMLLEQILSSLINATGAQYGCFLSKIPSGGMKIMLLRDFSGKNISPEDVVISQAIIDKTEAQKQLVLFKGYDTAFIQDNLYEEIRGKSILCTPLFRENNYLGCVYLGNDKVAGLFSESAVKITQILSAQASILLENALLLQDYVQLNQELDSKVKFQTRDILDKKNQLEQANLKLMESERMKGILTGSLVHDIKNYAAGIEGNLHFLNRKMSEDSKVHRVLDVIGESCSDIVSLASNLLDIAKMDEGKLIVRTEKLSIEYIEGLAEKFFQNPLFEEKGITPSIINYSTDIIISADSYLLERVFQNICSNAAKYVPAGGRFELDLKKNESDIEMSFYSSGTPIPDKERDNLFNKYARLESKQSRYSKGLGLFFCKMVMQAHKGKIWAESDEGGNYFKLSFPV